MPRYVYRCPACGAELELERPVADRDRRVYCKACRPRKRLERVRYPGALIVPPKWF